MARIVQRRSAGWAVAGCRLLLAGLALGTWGCAAHSAIPHEQGAARYKFEFTLSKAPEETGTCAAFARVTDLASKRKLTVPLFTALWGATTAKAAVDSAYGARFDVAVEVDAAGERGAFRGALHRGDLLVASDSVVVAVTVAKLKMKAVPR